MMHGREKSDSVIAAVKSPNKTGEPPGGRGSEGRGRRRMRASNARAGHRAGKACHRRRSAYGRPQGFAVTIRGGSRMRESRTSGSVRGDGGNPVPYRDNGIDASQAGYHRAVARVWLEWVFKGSGDLPR